MAGIPEEFIEDVLSVVERIPPGRAVTYGDIAAFLGRGGPRGVGGVMALEGQGVPWWRVVRANGSLPPHLMIDAQEHWHLEGMSVHRGVINLKEARWEITDG
ncbi:MGMT family protein [Nocardioides sp.]|uniref:MGMT family protein n=1 Tax=Nocardioides sp. TaxID=35761 RepID=UPI00261D9798|nr:MGMT family protein [Nocardioides sp.]